MNLSFCGSGFLGIYHLGVAEALIVNGSGLFKKFKKFGGASAGSLIATLLAVKGADLSIVQQSKTFTFDLTQLSKRRLVTGFCMLTRLEDFLWDVLPSDAHSIATGRLYISLTGVGNKKNYIVSDFQSNEQLVKYLLSSCYIPFVTAAGKKIITIEGENQLYYDGGFTDNLPIFTGQTVTVSPFSGKQHICPVDNMGADMYANLQNMDIKVNFQNIIRGWHALFPPNPETLEAYYTQGYQDTMRYLKTTGYL